MQQSHNTNLTFMYLSLSCVAFLNIICVVLITISIGYLRRNLADIDDKLEMLLIKPSMQNVAVFSVPFKSVEEFIGQKNKTKFSDLETRVKDAEDLLEKHLKTGEITKYQKWALVSFIVDMGKATFINSYIFRRVLDKEFDLVDDELRTWKCSDADKRALRAAEADLWEHKSK